MQYGCSSARVDEAAAASMLCPLSLLAAVPRGNSNMRRCILLKYIMPPADRAVLPEGVASFPVSDDS